MKFRSLFKFKILPIISHWKSPVKHFSLLTVEESKHLEDLFKYRPKELQLFSTILEKSAKEELNNICSIELALDYVAWTKISIPDLKILDWDAFKINLNLIKPSKNEEKMLELVNEVRSKIPNTDLYVMEFLKWNTHLKEIYFRAQLLPMLCFENGVFKEDKIIFQKRIILDKLFDLLVGKERKCARYLLKDILRIISGNKINRLNKYFILEWYSQIKVSDDLDKYFFKSSKEKQECLSLSFLTALSFLNMNFGTDQECSEEIQI